MNNKTSKAIFFDRDGTVIADKNYLKSPSEIEYLPGFFEGYKIVTEMGFQTFLITNQSGVARGYFTLEDVSLVHHQIQKDLTDRGLKPFTDIKFCPHEPKDNCACRKPHAQMALELLAEYKLDASQSFMLGDKDVDLEMAHKANLKGVLIPSHQSPKHSNALTFPNILEFSKWLSDN
ncbi:MAG: D-glycero-alpha-D-manno-heptose-1,7-bisphosphate 7-phosphatase [Bacteriovoracaceae bacterium]